MDSMFVIHGLLHKAQPYLPRRSSYAAYLVAMALTALALFARLTMAPVNAGLQYVTFFPAVTLAVVICGFGPGLMVTFIGVILATYFFTPPFYTFSFAVLNTSFWANFVFMADGLIVCLSIEAMHRYHLKYLAELVEAKVSSAKMAALNQALRDSEAFSRSVFDSRAEQVAVLNAHGVIVDVNEAWRQFADQNGAPDDAETGVGLNYLEVCKAALGQDDSVGSVKAATGIEAVLCGVRNEFNLEYPCHSPTTERWFNMRVTPLQGTLRGAVVAHENITSRKAMEKTLLHHAAIVESSEDAIIGKSLEGLITSWNRGAEKLFGYRSDEAVGKHAFLMIPRAYQEEERKVLEQVRNGIALTHYQTVSMRKDGTLIDISVTLSPLRDASGNVVGASKIARDITEQKRVEQELRIAATAFEAQEGMIVTDANNIILRVNQAFTLHTGYTAQEATGQHVRLLKSGRHGLDFYADMWKTIHRTGFWQGEIWNRRKNGDVYPEWLTITAVKNLTGDVTHYVGTHTDITTRKAAEDEIKHLAFYDPLTRLPNRRLLMDRLQHALSTSSRIEREGALMFIDLDNFKTLNDTLGHDAGDMLLQQVAQRLSTCVREGDTVARQGGDEFVVILETLSENTEDAVTQADSVGMKILDTLGQPYQLAGHEFYCTPSIGITLFGRRETSAENLLKEADKAMYLAKSAGRNTMRFFSTYVPS